MTLHDLYEVMDMKAFYPAGDDARDGERRMTCWNPQHEDSSPSMSVNMTSGLYHCKGCGEAGNPLTYWTKVLGKTREDLFAEYGSKEETDEDESDAVAIAQSQIELFKESLRNDTRKMAYLTEERGLSPEIIDRFDIGLFGDRYTIPVVEGGGVVNVRLYSPTAKAKMKNMMGRGKARLYLGDSIDDVSEVVVCEGEWDALLLWSHGIPAVSSTGGAGVWRDDWSKLLADKVTYVCYDVDAPGVQGAGKAISSLMKRNASNQVHCVRLPLDTEEYPTGDIGDYFLRAGGDCGSFTVLLEQARRGEDAKPELPVLHTDLLNGTMGENVGRLVNYTATVMSKSTVPKLLATSIQWKCNMSKGPTTCASCPVGLAAGDLTSPIDLSADLVVELAEAQKSRGSVKGIYKSACGVPVRCNIVRLTVKDSVTAEDVRIQTPVTNEHKTEVDVSNQHVVRPAIVLRRPGGSLISTNAVYDMETRAAASATTGEVFGVVHKATPAVDDVETYQMPPDIQRRLKELFARRAGESLDDIHERIYSDLEENVTKIYGRRDLHHMVDLVYHSPLYLNVGGRRIKGYVEALILGDSGQGKSEAVLCLRNHYGVGKKIDCKGATAAGLLGGVQQRGNGWFLTWGTIPQNDKRLVIFEEVKGMDTDQIGRLTDMRSGGMAELTKIEKASTPCRVRMLWVSNPREERQITFYDHGVEAVKSLYGALEDVRRLDVAMCVSTHEVETAMYNTIGERPVVEHQITEELAHNLVLWCWSRKVDDVVFSTAAIQAIHKGAEALAKKYDSVIPLVEPADQRYKLARLSAAAAGRLYSTWDGKTLNVEHEHVEFALQFVQRCYDSPYMLYDKYSAIHRTRQVTVDHDLFMKTFTKTAMPRALAVGLLNNKTVTKNTLKAYSGMQGMEAKEWADNFVSFLIRNNTLREYKGQWQKETPFTNWLRKRAVIELPKVGSLETESGDL